MVGVPDEQWGETPRAFVVLRAGATAPAKRTCGRSAHDHLAHFKVPQIVTFVTELPKTATGKIQKYVLRGQRAAIGRQ